MSGAGLVAVVAPYFVVTLPGRLTPREPRLRIFDAVRDERAAVG